MISKVKSGTLTKIPHLKGKSTEQADDFFKKAGDVQGYNMRLIAEDWYLEQLAEDKNKVDDTHNTAITGYTLNTLQEYAEAVIKTVDAIEPEYYKNLENWCNPRAYFFIGDWKDIENAYALVITLNQ